MPPGDAVNGFAVPSDGTGILSAAAVAY